jgi:hypothetical protein
MDPRKQDARRGFREREAIRRQNASQWHKKTFPQKEGKMNAGLNETRRGIGPGARLLLVLLFLVIVVACVLVLWNPFGIQITRSLTTPPPAAVEKNSVSLLPTTVPPVPTEVPSVVEPTVAVPIVCNTPSIQAEVTLDGKQLSASGEYLDTILGKRMTFTSRRLLIPEKAWNDALSDDELKVVEQTWQTIQVCVPEGMFGRVFAGGYEQKIQRYENGALLSLKPGLYEFNLRNGEIVLWYPQQDSFSASDLERIIDQIKNGNFDIKGELALFGVTSDMFSKIPNDLVKQNNVQTVSYPDPVVK